MLKDENELKEHITSNYQIFFNPPKENTISQWWSRVKDIPQVSEIENEILITMFIENEVKEPIFQMEHNRAPALDGLILLCSMTSLKENYHFSASVLVSLLCYQSAKKLLQSNNTNWSTF
jgi:hypothetical protein